MKAVVKSKAILKNIDTKFLKNGLERSIEMEKVKKDIKKNNAIKKSTGLRALGVSLAQR